MSGRVAGYKKYVHLNTSALIFNLFFSYAIGGKQQPYNQNQDYILAEILIIQL